MTFSGHDPTGGAGIQSDIEAIASMGCHATPVITCLTVQNTQEVLGVSPVETASLIQQARAVLEDMSIAVFKIGLLAATETVEAIHTLLRDYPQIPVVLDPVVLADSSGDPADSSILQAMKSLLFPLTTILTPNSIEARLFTQGADNLEAAAQQLMDSGCEYILLTGTHENTPAVENRLYSNRRLLDSFTWERLPGSYHGSGCTLAAATAGLIAHGLEPCTAIQEAQEYTWEALQHAYRTGMGQSLPNRLFWALYYEGLGDSS